MVDLAKELPVSLASVHVSGAPNTRTGFLDAIIRPHLTEPSISSDTFENVLQRTTAITQALTNTDTFSLIQPTLKRSDSIYASKQDVELHIRLKEKSRQVKSLKMFFVSDSSTSRRFLAKTSTELGSNEGSAVCVSCCSP